MHINSTLHECESILMSDKTMHLQAGTVQNIKYTTLIFLCHIPKFNIHESVHRSMNQ
jgi:hypothetical protein